MKVVIFCIMQGMDMLKYKCVEIITLANELRLKLREYTLVKPEIMSQHHPREGPEVA